MPDLEGTGQDSSAATSQGVGGVAAQLASHPAEVNLLCVLLLVSWPVESYPAFSCPSGCSSVE